MADNLVKLATSTAFELCIEIINELMVEYRQRAAASIISDNEQLVAVDALSHARERIQAMKDKLK